MNLFHQKVIGNTLILSEIISMVSAFLKNKPVFYFNLIFNLPIFIIFIFTCTRSKFVLILVWVLLKILEILPIESLKITNLEMEKDLDTVKKILIGYIFVTIAGVSLQNNGYLEKTSIFTAGLSPLTPITPEWIPLKSFLKTAKYKEL